jgi:hypothetical protein
MNMTVNLVAEVKNGKPIEENVLVEQLDTNRYRLVRSPGLVPGLAANDEFELTNDETHGYRLLKRAGNICVQMFFPGDAKEWRKALVPLVEEAGGWLDGEASTSNRCMLVLTFPVRVGFPVIESLMAKAKAISPRCEWFYGNVYDLNDGVTPLNWWAQA